jgi:hypothetical protein
VSHPNVSQVLQVLCGIAPAAKVEHMSANALGKILAQVGSGVLAQASIPGQTLRNLKSIATNLKATTNY